MVSAYFKNVGQTRTLIQLLQERSEIQQISSQEMRKSIGILGLAIRMPDPLLFTKNLAAHKRPHDLPRHAVVKQAVC